MVKENEIRNTRNLIEKSEKSVFDLRMKVENIAQIDEIMQMEDQIRVNNESKVQQMKKIKEAELKIKECGRQLLQMEDEDDLHRQIRNYKDDFAFWKEKIKKVEELIEIENKNEIANKDLLEKIRAGNLMYREQITMIKMEKGIED